MHCLHKTCLLLFSKALILIQAQACKWKQAFEESYGVPSIVAVAQAIQIGVGAKSSEACCQTFEAIRHAEDYEEMGLKLRL